ncbi:tetratricopeptide repeat protein [Aeromonas hydrophila]|nr:sel1 repeat family protein [Aeromonas hydrophila]
MRFNFIALALLILTINGVALSADWSEQPLSKIKQAAQKGEPEAQRTLGWMYSNGFEVPQSDEEAIFWYEKSAEQGNARSQFFLGVRLASRGDNSQAYLWYTKAAKQGDADAQFALGVMYQDGLGIPQDYIKSYAWLSVSAANGDKNAARFRDYSADKLSKQALIEAQALAEKYFQKNKKQ